MRDGAFCGGGAMNLVVHIPHRMVEDDVGALSLAQRAPAFIMERTGSEEVCIASFPNLPAGIDLALQLVGEAGRLRGAWASIDARPISNLTKLWQRLECYRESLLALDPLRHCREKAELFHTLVGCESRSCPVPCQFLCTPCMEQASGQGQEGYRLEEIAEFGDIGWCPQLKQAFPRSESQPMLIHPQSSRPPHGV
jgi:hypothetical protein